MGMQGRGKKGERPVWILDARTALIVVIVVGLSVSSISTVIQGREHIKYRTRQHCTLPMDALGHALCKPPPLPT